MAWVVSAVAAPAQCAIEGEERSVLAVRVRDMDGLTQLLLARTGEPPAWIALEEIDGGAWLEPIGLEAVH